MAWFKVDDGFHGSRQVLKIPKRQRAAAVGFWTLAGAWSARELTDGFIPDYMVSELFGTPRLAGELVACGLWEVVSEGWHFVGWEKYQPTGDQVRSDRKRKADWVAARRASSQAGKRDGRRQSLTSGNDEMSTVDTTSTGPSTDGQQTVDFFVPTRPDLDKEHTTTDPEPDGFAEWWSAYPKSAGKKAARTAYARALKSKTDPVTVEELLRGAERYRDNPQRKPEYTKNATTWLNGGHWADEVETPKRNQGGGRLWQE